MSTSEVLLPIQTVDKKTKIFTDRQRAAVQHGPERSRMRMGYPSDADIIEGINKGRILNLT
jgi:hypothetical protein